MLGGKTYAREKKGGGGVTDWIKLTLSLTYFNFLNLEELLV